MKLLCMILSAAILMNCMTIIPSHFAFPSSSSGLPQRDPAPLLEGIDRQAFFHGHFSLRLEYCEAKVTYFGALLASLERGTFLPEFYSENAVRRMEPLYRVLDKMDAYYAGYGFDETAHLTYMDRYTIQQLLDYRQQLMDGVYGGPEEVALEPVREFMTFQRDNAARGAADYRQILAGIEAGTFDCSTVVFP